MLGDPRDVMTMLRKGLRVTVCFSVKVVFIYAYPRFTVKSWKGSRTNPQNTGYYEEESEPKVQKQAQLREKSTASKKSWAKLGLNRLQPFYLIEF